MSFLPAQDDDEVMTEINMTPLIDVMLVLLVVFILAVPTIHNAEPVRLDIDAQGHTYWNGKPVDDDTLKAQAQQAAMRDPQPVVRLSGDRAVPYERVLQTLSTLQSAGLAKVNFIAQRP